MICLETVKRFCQEYWKIENYDQAVADESQTWDCHHRHEIDWVLPRKELIAIGRYYDVHYSELIFLTPEEHRRLHNIGKVGPWKGKHRTEETKAKMSTAKKGNQNHLKYYITADELYDLYIVQGLSQSKIAKMYGCTWWCIYHKLKKFNIKK